MHECLLLAILSWSPARSVVPHPYTNIEQCSLPKQTGDCSEKHARWQFSETEKRCVPFYYSGCGGNKNNFPTLESCEDHCPRQVGKLSMLLQWLLMCEKLCPQAQILLTLSYYLSQGYLRYSRWGWRVRQLRIRMVLRYQGCRLPSVLLWRLRWQWESFHQRRGVHGSMRKETRATNTSSTTECRTCLWSAGGAWWLWQLLTQVELWQI